METWTVSTKSAVQQLYEIGPRYSLNFILGGGIGGKPTFLEFLMDTAEDTLAEIASGPHSVLSACPSAPSGTSVSPWWWRSSCRAERPGAGWTPTCACGSIEENKPKTYPVEVLNDVSLEVWVSGNQEKTEQMFFKLPIFHNTPKGRYSILVLWEVKVLCHI